MGKYMKKAKIAGEVAVMEVCHQSSLGVRTRARTRTLALQRLQRAAVPAAEAASYLQLRNRRLEKPPVPGPGPGPKEPLCKEEPNPNPSPSPRSSHSRLGAGPRNSGSMVGSVSIRSCCAKREEASPEIDGGVEVSFGENVLDLEVRARNARETTPCSLIRDSETIGTPGSTTRCTNSTATKKRIQNSMLRNMPTAQEIEEFFTEAEQLQQRTFSDKYNFDPVNSRPLPGRYEWVKLDD